MTVAAQAFDGVSSVVSTTYAPRFRALYSPSFRAGTLDLAAPAHDITSRAACLAGSTSTFQSHAPRVTPPRVGLAHGATSSPSPGRGFAFATARLKPAQTAADHALPVAQNLTRSQHESVTNPRSSLLRPHLGLRSSNGDQRTRAERGNPRGTGGGRAQGQVWSVPSRACRWFRRR